MKWALVCVFSVAIQACSSQTTTPGEDHHAAVQVDSAEFPLVASIELPRVEGRIDHLAFDVANERLWIAALENGSLECIDARAAQYRGHCAWPKEPQGVAFVDGRAWVADGERGELDAYESVDENTERAPRTSVAIGVDADNVRYVSRSNVLVVGYGDGGLAIVDPRKAVVIARIPLAAHPESFQIAADGKRCWVNLPGARSIAVVDLEARSVLRSIRVEAAEKNYPMALVEADHRLIVGCRAPAKLLVFDIDSDALVAELPLSGDVDDVFVDTERGFVYAACGEGFVDVFEHVKSGEWKPRTKFATAAGARTCLFVPEQKRLFVAVPHRGTQRAEVRVFATER